jgi:hypothetical protein
VTKQQTGCRHCRLTSSQAAGLLLMGLEGGYPAIRYWQEGSPLCY